MLLSLEPCKLLKTLDVARVLSVFEERPICSLCCRLDTHLCIHVRRFYWCVNLWVVVWTALSALLKTLI